MIKSFFQSTSFTALILCGALAAPMFAYPQAQAATAGQLTVRVTGVRSAEGNIRIAVRNDENTVVASRTIEIDPKTLTAQTVFDKLPQGTYGIAVFHDENKNGKLDFNEMGMPVEGYGHSNNPGKRMGPPSFDETKFTLDQSGSSIEIRLIYWM